jgi:hypothetical protein
MNDKICLLGIPGLYQNWLMSAVDCSSKHQQLNDTNFHYEGKNISFYRKFITDVGSVTNYDHIINCYVDEENFVWYLYTFLEKTSEIGILVDDLINCLLTKAEGTLAFDFLFKHFIQSYDITKDSTVDYCKNSAIEYFYFLLSEKNKNNEFKAKAAVNYTGNKYINIEYNDFLDSNLLIDKLQGLSIFNEGYFLKMYSLLSSTNSRYLNKHKTFLDKLQLKNPNFDILELAHLGALITKKTGSKLDWFNPDVRSVEINKHFGL